MNDVEFIAKPMTEAQLVRRILQGKGHGNPAYLDAFLNDRPL